MEVAAWPQASSFMRVGSIETLALKRLFNQSFMWLSIHEAIRDVGLTDCVVHLHVYDTHTHTQNGKQTTEHFIHTVLELHYNLYSLLSLCVSLSPPPQSTIWLRSKHVRLAPRHCAQWKVRSIMLCGTAHPTPVVPMLLSNLM